MSTSFLIWLAWAIVLFWAIGAYNRLMRLRTQAGEAFGELAQVLRQLGDLAGQIDEPALGSLATANAVRDGLEGARRQLDTALKVAHQKPLDAAGLTVLTMAYQALAELWQRYENATGARQDATDLAVRWQQGSHQLARARASFNQSVAAYNQAVAQFPALLLARLFGLRAAREFCDDKR